VTVYLVLYPFGRLGSAYREADEEYADLENVVYNMLHGEYNDPRRVVAFNTAEKWSSDARRMSLGGSQTHLESRSRPPRHHPIVL
jgi:hypothetical protein